MQANKPAQRHEAARVAGNLAGVRSVDNGLHINDQGELVGSVTPRQHRRLGARRADGR